MQIRTGRLGGQLTKQRHTPTSGILDLLLQAKASTGLTDAEIAEAAGIPTKTKAETVRNTLRRRRSIHVALADWVLAHTLGADPPTAALGHLQRAGLTHDQVQVIASLVNEFTGRETYAMPDDDAPASVDARLVDLLARTAAFLAELATDLPRPQRTDALAAAQELTATLQTLSAPPGPDAPPASPDTAARRGGSAATDGAPATDPHVMEP